MSSHAVGNGAEEAAARDLVAQLDDNLNGSHSENSPAITTCHAFLRRSKALPCRQVKDLAVSIFSTSSSSSSDLAQVLFRANEILLHQYASSDFTADVSSFKSIHKITAVNRFLQLLILVSDKQQQQIMPPTIPKGQVDQWMANLLKALVTSICNLVRASGGHGSTGGGDGQYLMNDQYDDDDDDVDDPLMVDLTTGCRDARSVLVFACRSLLRFNKKYVEGRISLLAPVWKGMCDLTDVLRGVVNVETTTTTKTSSENQDGDDNASTFSGHPSKMRHSWRQDCFETLLGDTLQAFHETVREGKNRLESIIIQHLIQTQSASDGELSPSSSTLKANRDMQVKIVGFMVTRLCQLMDGYFSLVPLSDEDRRGRVVDGRPATPNTKPAFLDEIWDTLFGLRGLATTLQNLASLKTDAVWDASQSNVDRAFCKPFCEIAARTGKVMDSVLTLPQDLLVQASAISSILRIQSSQCGDNSSDILVGFLTKSSRAIGRVLTLQHVLAVARTNATENIESLLAVVEDLHSVSVPSCLSVCIMVVEKHYKADTMGPVDGTLLSTIVLKSLQMMVRVLKGIDETLIKDSASAKQAGFYRLLINWLSGTKPQPGQKEQRQHPMAQEMVLALFESVLLEFYLSGHGQSASKILCYMTKLLFDARTGLSIRRSIASILVRLQSLKGPVSSTARTLLEQELEGWVKLTAVRPKKRKRSKGAPQSILQNPCDLFQVSRTLRGSGMSPKFHNNPGFGSLLKAIQNLHRDTRAGDETEVLGSAECNVVLMAWLERFTLSDSATSAETFRQLKGIDLRELTCEILLVIGKMKIESSNARGQSVRKKVIFYAAGLRLAATACSKPTECNSALFECICKLVTRVSSYIKSARKDQSEMPSKYAAMLTLESSSLLGRLGGVVPTDCSAHLLKDLQQSSHRLLSVNDWAITSHGLSCLTVFGGAIHPSHQHILPHCLPEWLTPALQRHITSRERSNPTKCDGKDWKSCLRRLNRTARQLDPLCFATGRDNIENSIFPSVAVLQIEPGSYFLDMKCLPGRKNAYVIYPPGQESLQDIRDMLSGGGPAIQTLTRAIPVSNGSIKCLLRS